MGPVLSLEMRRALGNRLTIVCLAIGLGLAIVAVAEGIGDFRSYFSAGQTYVDDSYTGQYARGAFTEWMPMAVMRSAPNLFFFLAPLLVALAYSWSRSSDIQGGYAAQMLVRTARPQWELAKLAAVFVAGGCVVALPLLVNLVVVLCFVPAYTPDIVDVVYTGLWVKVFLSGLLYQCPVAYAAARILLDFVLAGLWATTVLSLSRFIRGRVAIVALPYVCLVLVKLISDNLYALVGVRWGALTILDQLKARGDQFYYGWDALLAGIFAMLVVSLVISVLGRRRDIL